MKSLMRMFAIGLGGILWLSALNAPADVSVFASVQINAEADFSAPLAAHGAWVEVDSYGRCWRPAGVAVDWQPYCYGYWVWTDFGWYWVSDEPWAWACYHYGHWFHHHHHGWVWIPGTEWAPAWVSWRVGGGYVGWAPLPPRGRLFARVPEPPFFFVQAGRFHEPVRPSTVIVNNTTIINQTTVVNNMRQETRTVGDAGPRKVMINEGPGRAEMDKATGNKVRTATIQQAVQQTPVPKEMESKKIEPGAKQSPDRPPTQPERKPASTEKPDATPKPTPPPPERKPERTEKPTVSPKPSPPTKVETNRPPVPPERKPERIEKPDVAPPSTPPKVDPDRPRLVPEHRRDPEPVLPKHVPPAKGKEPAIEPSHERPAAPVAPPDDPSKGKGKGKDRKKKPDEP